MQHEGRIRRTTGTVVRAWRRVTSKRAMIELVILLATFAGGAGWATYDDDDADDCETTIETVEGD